MNRAQSCFLKALQKAIQGKKYDVFVDNEETLRWILHTASIQKVLPMVCEAIYESGVTKKYFDVFSAYQKKAVKEVVSQTVRTAQFLDLYRYLGSRGLIPVLVKGLAVRALYPRENLRMSVDEDLLIAPHQKYLYHEALLDYGMCQMDPEQKIEKDSEISYKDPESGLYIEVHQYLFPPESEVYGDLNRFFEKIKPVKQDYKGQELLTLDPTDHLFFLICHSFKHFLHSGFGIRQICDLALFSDAYADEIDWDRIWLQCHQINGERFVWALYRIGNKYLMPDNRYEFYLEKWDIENVDEEPLLLDVLESGVHGASEMTRLHSSNITLNAVANHKNNKRAKASVWGSVFLPLEKMKVRYKYLERAPFFLPAAWIQRVYRYGREILAERKGTSSVMNSVSLGRQRVELLRYYGIIK